MAYVFTNQDSATFKFTTKNAELSVNGVNGTEQSADVIVNGVMALLHIGGISTRYNPEDAIRTVRQNVDLND